MIGSWAIWKKWIEEFVEKYVWEDYGEGHLVENYETE
jgi:hypothetical protein